MLSDRASILNQVATGQISAEEAARRLSQPRGGSGAELERLKGRWFRVRVTRLATGAPKLSVDLPLSWVHIGLQLGARYHPEVAGVDWNEVLALIQSGADGRLLEVEDLESDERIEIFVG